MLAVGDDLEVRLGVDAALQADDEVVDVVGVEDVELVVVVEVDDEEEPVSVGVDEVLDVVLVVEEVLDVVLVEEVVLDVELVVEVVSAENTNDSMLIPRESNIDKRTARRCRDSREIGDRYITRAKSGRCCC